MVGKSPPVWHDSSRVISSTNDAAKDEAQANTQHEGPTALPRECDLVGQETGASRAFACASCQTNCTASSLHLPRVSIATTTRRQRADATNSEYVVSLSILAWANIAPSMSAARGLGSPEPPNALRKLRPAEARQVFCYDLDAALIVGANMKVHVPQDRSVPDACPCLPTKFGPTSVRLEWPGCATSLFVDTRQGGGLSDRGVRDTQCIRPQ